VTLTLYKLKAYIKKIRKGHSGQDFSLVQSNSGDNFLYLQQAQETLTELLTINAEAIKNQSTYNSDFFKNITKSFY